MGVCITSGCTRNNQPPCLFCKECFDPPLEVWDKWAREDGFSSWKEKEGHRMGFKKTLCNVFMREALGSSLSREEQAAGVRKVRVGILAALVTGMATCLAAYTGIDDGLVLVVLEGIAGVFQ